ncbi:MAG: shikimate dehydrogenase [Firmicutes bacterium]|nr:shikimate dehydrogenase [Bacillota bacterium]
MNAINGKTLVYGIIGYPVEHSFSPAMQNAAFQAAGLNGVYVAFAPAPEQLEAAVEGIKALGLAGVNVTVPYKEAVMDYLDDLTTEAMLCGAVNTIINWQGKLTGHNTDGAGFISDLRGTFGFEPSRGAALLLGAGGAARAVAVSLAGAGCRELALVNRNQERARKLAAGVISATGVPVQVFPWESGHPGLASFARRAVLLVNCTPVGMSGKGNNPFPLPETLPGPGQLAYDLVYNPSHTPFMRQAESNGAKTANGLGMLLYQGALAFTAWTGLEAPLETMRRVLLEQISG